MASLFLVILSLATWRASCMTPNTGGNLQQMAMVPPNIAANFANILAQMVASSPNSAGIVSNSLGGPMLPSSTSGTSGTPGAVMSPSNTAASGTNSPNSAMIPPIPGNTAGAGTNVFGIAMLPTIPGNIAGAGTNIAGGTMLPTISGNTAGTGTNLPGGAASPGNTMPGTSANTASNTGTPGSSQATTSQTKQKSAIQSMFESPLGIHGTYLTRILPPSQMNSINRMAQLALCRNTQFSNQREFLFFGRCTVGDPNACGIMEMRMAAHNGPTSLSLYYSGIRYYSCVAGMCCLKSNFALQHLDQP